MKMYRDRYPGYPDEKWLVIPNGYDESIFEEVDQALPPQKGSRGGGPVVLVHSGVIYPQERDPGPFFEAIASLCASGSIDSKRVRIILRACGHGTVFQPMLEQMGIEHIVRMEPSIPYREALSEILQADGLLVLQAANCNHQIPAKIYEYFRAGRPILALTDPSGDTATALVEAGIKSVAPLDDMSAIRGALLEFIVAIERNGAEIACEEAVKKSSREFAVGTLARVFDELTQQST